MLLQLSVRPFPWPAATEDLGAASAAAFLNLLLVFSFLAPTRGMVLAVVSERELRLREGMKILGEFGASGCSNTITCGGDRVGDVGGQAMRCMLDILSAAFKTAMFTAIALLL